MNKVSIIITNHNYGRFLTAAIESALAQTHPRCEVIVVDDGSTDQSRAVITRFATIQPLFQNHRGQAAAFNAGFARASGDVVIFLDADDTLAPATAARVADIFATTPAATKVMYRLAVIDELGTPTGEIKPPAHLPLRNGDLRRHTLSFPFDVPWMATSGNAFRAAALTQIFPIPVADYPRVGADWYLAHLTPLLGTVVFLGDVGGAYRVHRGNHYERETGTLDLDQVRQSIVYSRITARHIADLAKQLELAESPKSADDLLSVAEIWQRIISLRLDPRRHPVPEDQLLRLVALGMRAAARRFDVALPLKVFFATWSTTMAIAPKTLLPVLLRFLARMRRGTPAQTLLRPFHRAGEEPIDITRPAA